MPCRSYFFKGHDFIDMLSALNKAQRGGEKNIVTMEQAKKAAHLFDCVSSLGSSIYVEVTGGFSFEGFTFKSFTTILTINKDGGIARRCEAETAKYGKGFHVKVFIENPSVPSFRILNMLPGFVEELTGQDNYLIFSGD